MIGSVLIVQVAIAASGVVIAMCQVWAVFVMVRLNRSREALAPPGVFVPEDVKFCTEVVPAAELVAFCKDHNVDIPPSLIAGLEPPAYMVNWREKGAGQDK